VAGSRRSPLNMATDPASAAALYFSCGCLAARARWILEDMKPGNEQRGRIKEIANKVPGVRSASICRKMAQHDDKRRYPQPRNQSRGPERREHYLMRKPAAADGGSTIRPWGLRSPSRSRAQRALPGSEYRADSRGSAVVGWARFSRSQIRTEVVVAEMEWSVHKRRRRVGYPS